MTAKTNFQVINPPNKLARKVPRSGGPDLETIVNNAETALRELKVEYDQWIREDLERMETALKAAEESPEKSEASIKAIYDTGYDIKGHGATFEFPLLGMIADSLCSLITDAKVSAAQQLHLIRLHVDAMRVVVNESVDGAGGDQGKELIAMLRTAVDRVANA